jgi:hypothetical protein
METIIRDVRNIDKADRLALENVIGDALRDDQRVVINVVDLDATETSPGQDSDAGSCLPQEVPDWWKIYEGLSEEEVDRLDGAIRQRADLTRTFE